MWSISFHAPVLSSILFLSVTCSIQYRAQMHFNLVPHHTLPIFSSFGGLAVYYCPSGLTVQYVTKYAGLLPWELGVNNVLFKGPFLRSGVKFHGLTWYCPDIVAFDCAWFGTDPSHSFAILCAVTCPEVWFYIPLMFCKPASHVPYCKNTLWCSCDLSVRTD